MSIFRAAFSILIIGGTLFAVLGKAGAAEFNVEVAGMAPQTSSTIPVNDDRVARIETRGTDAETGNLGETLTCTANHLGEGLWITAKHCFNEGEARSEIRQSDGDRARIIKTFMAPEGVDIALFAVDDIDISSASFFLVDKAPVVSNELTLIGYAAVHSYASEAQVDVIEGVQDNLVLWQQYRNSFKTVSRTPSRTCGGDSGGAVYKGDKRLFRF